jgi:hypothetical protein
MYANALIKISCPSGHFQSWFLSRYRDRTGTLQGKSIVEQQ